MPGRLVCAVATTAALAATGCARSTRPLPASCVEGSRPIATALTQAPGPVSLADGTRLSTCVERATTDADLQNLGALYTRVADRLRTRLHQRDDAAVQLGYLIGATRRGASRTNGIHVELVRRLEQTVGLDGAPATRRRAFRRGLAAGSRNG